MLSLVCCGFAFIDLPTTQCSSSLSSLDLLEHHLTRAISIGITGAACKQCIRGDRSTHCKHVSREMSLALATESSPASAFEYVAASCSLTVRYSAESPSHARLLLPI